VSFLYTHLSQNGTPSVENVENSFPDIMETHSRKFKMYKLQPMLRVQIAADQQKLLHV
jgi:hypothetical protein